MISRPLSGRPASANPVPFDVTRLTLMAFGPSLFVAIVATALMLVKVWR